MKKNFNIIKIEGTVIRGRRMTSTITIKQNIKTCHVIWNCGEIDCITYILRFFEKCLIEEGMPEALREWWYRWKPNAGANPYLFSSLSCGSQYIIPKDTAYELVGLIHTFHSYGIKQLETNAQELSIIRW